MKHETQTLTGWQPVFGMPFGGSACPTMGYAPTAALTAAATPAIDLSIEAVVRVKGLPRGSHAWSPPRS